MASKLARGAAGFLTGLLQGGAEELDELQRERRREQEKKEKEEQRRKRRVQRFLSSAMAACTVQSGGGRGILGGTPAQEPADVSLDEDCFRKRVELGKRGGIPIKDGEEEELLKAFQNGKSKEEALPDIQPQKQQQQESTQSEGQLSPPTTAQQGSARQATEEEGGQGPISFLLSPFSGQATTERDDGAQTTSAPTQRRQGVGQEGFNLLDILAGEPQPPQPAKNDVSGFGIPLSPRQGVGQTDAEEPEVLQQQVPPPKDEIELQQKIPPEKDEETLEQAESATEDQEGGGTDFKSQVEAFKEEFEDENQLFSALSSIIPGVGPDEEEEQADNLSQTFKPVSEDKGKDKLSRKEKLRKNEERVKSLLQEIREKTGANIRVTNLTRTPEENKAIDGAEGSQHLKGAAVDFIVGNSTDTNKPVNATIDPFETLRVAEFLRKNKDKVGEVFVEPVNEDSNRMFNIHVSLRENDVKNDLGVSLDPTSESVDMLGEDEDFIEAFDRNFGIENALAGDGDLEQRTPPPKNEENLPGTETLEE